MPPGKSRQGGGESQVSTLPGLKGRWPASIWTVSEGFLEEGEMDLVGERGGEEMCERTCLPPIENQGKHRARKWATGGPSGSRATRL